MKKRALVVALVLAVSGSGCSWLFMEKAPDGYRPPAQLDCTATTGWAVWDIVQAVGHAGSGGFAFIQVQNADANEVTAAAAPLIAFNVAMTVVHLASASSGFSNVRRCKKLRAQRDSYVPPVPRTEPVHQPPKAQPKEAQGPTILSTMNGPKSVTTYLTTLDGIELSIQVQIEEDGAMAETTVVSVSPVTRFEVEATIEIDNRRESFTLTPYEGRSSGTLGLDIFLELTKTLELVKVTIGGRSLPFDVSSTMKLREFVRFVRSQQPSQPPAMPHQGVVPLEAPASSE